LDFVGTGFVEYRAPFRFCLRVTLAGILAFGLSQLWNFPLRGLWAVLTAIVVTQAGGGGSMSAIIEYVVGTLAGAVYAGVVSVMIPHATMPALTGVLALSIAPLALSASINPMFRVAPFTAAIVLLVSTGFRESPVQSAIYRVLEVLTGGVSVIVTSLLILPERAYSRGLNAAADILERLAQILPRLLAGLSAPPGPLGPWQLQEGLGEAITNLETIVNETKLERRTYLRPEVELSPLSRTVLRLRHDLVIVGRAAVTPLPEPFATPLGAMFGPMSSNVGDFLRGCAIALVERRGPPSLEGVEVVLREYKAAFAKLKDLGLTTSLAGSESERIFTLAFAFEELAQNLADLHRCVQECANISGRSLGFR
jgi:uncharacterized membrane protein YccC